MYTPNQRRVSSGNVSPRSVKSRESISDSGKKLENALSSSQFIPKSRAAPFVYGVKNQNFVNPSFKSDSALSNPNYPGAAKYQKITSNPAYSPIRKKTEVASKVGSPEHYKVLAAESLTPLKQTAKKAEKERDWTPQPKKKLEFECVEIKDASENLKVIPPKKIEERPRSASIAIERVSTPKQEVIEPQKDAAPEKKALLHRWGSRQAALNKALANQTSEPAGDKSRPSKSPGLATIKETAAESGRELKFMFGTPQKQETLEKSQCQDELIKPFNANTTESPSTISARKKKQEITPKVTEQSFEQKPLEAKTISQQPSAPVIVNKEEVLSKTGDRTPAKDTDSQCSSLKSDALLCDTCINDLILQKKQCKHIEQRLADQEILRQAGQEIQQSRKILDQQEQEMAAKRREVSSENKRMSEANKLKKEQAKLKEQEEYNKQLEEIERGAVDRTSKLAERKQNYRDDLLRQIEEDKQRKNAWKDRERSPEDTGLYFPEAGRRDYSPADLKIELLNQIQNKADQKNLDKFEIEREYQRNLEEQRVRENEIQLLAADRERQQKEEYRKALDEGVEAKRMAREQEKESKLREREELELRAEAYKDSQERALIKKQHQREALKQNLLDQIQDKRASRSPEQRIEEEEVNRKNWIENKLKNLFVSYG